MGTNNYFLNFSLFKYSAGAETISDVTNAVNNSNNNNNNSNSKNNNLNVIDDATMGVSNAFEIIANDNVDPDTGTDANTKEHKHISSVTQAINATHTIGAAGAGGGDAVAITPSKGSSIASTTTILSDEFALAGHSDLVASSSLNIRRDIATTVAHTPPITTNRPCEYLLFSATIRLHIMHLIYMLRCNCIRRAVAVRIVCFEFPISRDYLCLMVSVHFIRVSLLSLLHLSLWTTSESNGRSSFFLFQIKIKMSKTCPEAQTCRYKRAEN